MGYSVYVYTSCRWTLDHMCSFASFNTHHACNTYQKDPTDLLSAYVHKLHITKHGAWQEHLHQLGKSPTAHLVMVVGSKIGKGNLGETMGRRYAPPVEKPSTCHLHAILRQHAGYALRPERRPNATNQFLVSTRGYTRKVNHQLQ